MTVDADQLHRTIKLEADEGRAASLGEAAHLAQSYVLQIAVGANVAFDPTCQAMLLTAVNAGRRAFLGGVRVRGESNPTLALPWAAGRTLTDAVVRFGGRLIGTLDAHHPTLVIGHPAGSVAGSIVLQLTWEGWSGGIVTNVTDRLAEATEFEPAGVLAAGLGVSEAFQHARGSAVAGRRNVGLSLWRPDLDWRQQESYGEPCHYLPSRLWLLGLGHLGQAYAWTLGCLPYPEPGDVSFTLQDVDVVTDANEATGLLVGPSSVNKMKTRVTSQALEALRFRTRIVERMFDEHTVPRPDEPSWVLAGLDDPSPRRALGVFGRALDAGLGAGADDYLDILIHAFPSSLEPANAFQDRPGTQQRRAARLADQPAYRDLEHQTRTDAGLEGEVRCGILEAAGQAVGAAFVGTVAASVVVGEALRALNDGPQHEVIALPLREPEHRQVVPNGRPARFDNPGFVSVMRR